MAILNFSALSHNQVVAFDALADVLVFDSATISAALVSVAGTATGSTVVFTYAGKKITLSGVNLRELSTANISFADGSRLIVGDNTTGTSGDQLANTLVGTARADQLNGQGGADTMSGGAGNDTYIVNTAADVVVEAANGGTDRMRSSVSLTLADNVEILELLGTAHLNATGNALNNTLVGNAGNNVLDGGAGIDAASYTRAGAGVTVSLAIAGPQNTVGAGSDQLDGIESLIGSRFNDSLTGSGEDNSFTGGLGNDTITGGAGRDTAIYTGAAAVNVSLAIVGPQNTLGAGTDSLAGIENLLGGSGNDTLGGNGSDNVLSGGAGNDSLDGGSGTDTLIGGTGNDTLVGGLGADTAVYSGSAAVNVSLATTQAQDTLGASTDALQGVENLTGGNGNDTLAGNVLDNVLDGGGGVNTVTYADALAGVRASLQSSLPYDTATAGLDTLRNFSVLVGSAFDDDLRGSLDSTLIGGLGDDNLYGSRNYDVSTSAFVGTTVSYAGLSGPVTVYLGGSATGPEGTDRLVGIYGVIGGDGNDSLYAGSDGYATLEGGGGDDFLSSSNSFSSVVSYASATTGVTVNLGTVGAQNTIGAGVDTLVGFRGLRGSSHADVLTGAATNDTLDGGAGNDTLDGGAGADTLTFGRAGSGTRFNLSVTTAQNTQSQGTDTAINFENLIGSAYNDTLTGSALGNRIEGGSGNDVLSGADGDDTLVGGFGNDTLRGGAGSDTLSYDFIFDEAVQVRLGVAGPQQTGGAGIDDIADFEHLFGTSQSDLLIGDAGNNEVHGGYGGYDTVEGGLGNDTLVGDVASYALGAAVLVDLRITGPQNTIGAGVDTLDSQVRDLIGSAGNDTLIGDADAFRVNRLEGGAGNDRLQGVNLPGLADIAVYTRSASGVTIDLGNAGPQNTGGAGTDTLIDILSVDGSLHNDVISGSGTAGGRLYGDAGNDVLSAFNPGDTLEGGAGNDSLYGSGSGITASYASAGSGVTVDLRLTGPQATGGAGGDLLQGIQWLLGSAHDDALIGNAAANDLTGGAGNDMLNGLAGDDTLDGGTGDDVLDGGDGIDTLSYAGVFNGVVISLAVAGPQVTGGFPSGGGTDTLANFENLVGSDSGDRLTGNSANNLLSGGDGNDVLAGRVGDDTLDGGDGFDTADYSAESAVEIHIYASGFGYAINSGGTDQLTSIEGVIGSAGADDIEVSLFPVDGAELFVVLDGGGGDDFIRTNFSGGVGGRLSGGDGDDTIYGNLGDDSPDETLMGGDGNDRLMGIDGDDEINGGAGNDYLSGGDGWDTLSYLGASSGITLQLGVADNAAQNTAGAGIDEIELSTFEAILGSAHDDTFYATALRSYVIAGGTGNDLFIAARNDDTLSGGGNFVVPDFDTVSYVNATASVYVNLLAGETTGAWGANHTLYSIEGAIGSAHNDTLIGGDEDNALTGGLGNDLLIGGEGFDIAAYGTGAVTVTLATTDAQATGGAGSDRLFSIEGLRGGGSSDSLTGNDGANLLEGQTGNDTLNGAGGNDTLNGGSGTDSLNGGSGTDTVSYVSATSAVTVSLLVTGAQATSGGGTDTLSSFENLVGSRFNDSLTGSTGANRIEGGEGNDTIAGAPGNDTLLGGAGADRFVLSGTTGSDVVLDYSVADDTVALTLSTGDGDLLVEGATTRSEPGGFSTAAELVVFSSPIIGTIDTASAAAAIGSANSAYALFDFRLFVVNNGYDTAVYRFFSSDSDAQVESNELTLLATLQGTTGVTTADFVFVT